MAKKKPQDVPPPEPPSAAAPEPAPTFTQISEEFNRQYLAHRKAAEAHYNSEAYQSWQATPRDRRGEPPPYTGPAMDYGGLETMCVKAVEAMGFTRKQAQHIVGFAYQEHHAHFGDVLIYAQTYAEFVKSLPKD